MSKINCDVSNCSHNNNGICYANRVNISGKTASDNSSTCCGSYLNKLIYSSLTNSNHSESPDGHCDCIVCYTKTCRHNQNYLCSLDTVNVGGGMDAAIYTETNCESFEKNS